MSNDGYAVVAGETFDRKDVTTVELYSPKGRMVWGKPVVEKGCVVQIRALPDKKYPGARSSGSSR